jgi:hypothetical protein
VTSIENSVHVATSGTEDLGDEVTQYIAQCCTRTHVVNGKFFRSRAEVGSDGYITVEVERVNFDGPNFVIQTRLHPTTPVILPIEEPSLPALSPGGVHALDVPPDTAA